MLSRTHDLGLPGRKEKSMAVATHPQIDLHDNSLAGARTWFARKGLSRPGEGRVGGSLRRVRAPLTSTRSSRDCLAS